jgi:NhaP-type Na+/H+ or K+/H+ antiporter
LQESGYGVDKGIPTLVIAAASVDDVLAISGFGLVFGIAFSQGGLAMQILGGPLQALLGIIWGLITGIALWYVPGKDNENLPFLRCLLLIFAGVVALFGSPLIDFNGFGALATLSSAFVAGYSWKSDNSDKDVSLLFANLWYIFQPLLFGLIGVAIDVSRLKVETVAYGLLTLACGLTLRFLATVLVVSFAGLNFKERLFVGLAWLPKATVQAALASVVLDHAVNAGLGREVVEWGTDILTVAVLVILVTAPVGAVAIMLSAPRLLKLSQEEVPKADLAENGVGRVATESVILDADDVEMESRQ